MSPYVWPLPTLMSCRFITGVGVSIFTTGAFMIINDISTSLNRTRSMAPIMTGFQAGIALGPAVGGVAIQSLGIPFTYVSCGVLFTAVAVANHFLMHETMRPKPISASTAVGMTSTTTSINTEATTASSTSTAAAVPDHPFTTTVKSWFYLGKTNQRLRRICELNLFYWFALSGVQMTILPLYMVSPTFALSPMQIGTTFALMSVCSILSSQPSAYIADTVLGKVPSIIVGGGFVATSFCLLPFASTYTELLVILIPLSVGSTILQSVPSAYVADITNVSDRANSLSLFRTTGDVGLLFGASISGVVASMYGFTPAIETNAVIILSAVLYFAYRAGAIARLFSMSKKTPSHVVSDQVVKKRE